MRPSGERGTSEDTKARILDAALATLRREGVVGTSARAIARTGGFAPGLIFYHYGSVNGALVAAVRRLSAERVARYEQQLAEVATLADLVAVARALHDEDTSGGYVTVLSQMLAATAGDPELGAQLHGIFDPWLAVVGDTLERVLAGSTLPDLLPPDQAAYAVTSLFIGLELLAHLGGDLDRSAQLLETFGDLAEVAGALVAFLGGPRPDGG